MLRRQNFGSRLVCATALLALLETGSDCAKCSSPEVTYQDFRISGSHNKTGVWKTTLGNLKVAVEHAGKPLMKSMGTGQWEVSITVSSTVCGSSGTQDTGTISEEALSGDDDTSARSYDISESPSDTAAEDEAPQEDTDATTRRYSMSNGEDKQFASSHRFMVQRISDDGFVRDGDSDDDQANQSVEETIREMFSPYHGGESTRRQSADRSNEIPGGQRSVASEPVPEGRRANPPSWPGWEWLPNYRDYGRAGRISLFVDSLPWKLAKQRCEQDGAHLATVDSDDKVAALLELFSMYPRVPWTAVLKNQVYVGMNDRDEEGVFRTATGELFRPWNASVWMANEPDDAHGEEDCVTFHTEGRIRDVPCGFSLPFFCELDQP